VHRSTVARHRLCNSFNFFSPFFYRHRSAVFPGGGFGGSLSHLPPPTSRPSGEGFCFRSRKKMGVTWRNWPSARVSFSRVNMAREISPFFRGVQSRAMFLENSNANVCRRGPLIFLSLFLSFSPSCFLFPLSFLFPLLPLFLLFLFLCRNLPVITKHRDSGANQFREMPSRRENCRCDATRRAITHHCLPHSLIQPLTRLVVFIRRFIVAPTRVASRAINTF